MTNQRFGLVLAVLVSVALFAAPGVAQFDSGSVSDAVGSARETLSGGRNSIDRALEAVSEGGALEPQLREAARTLGIDYETAVSLIAEATRVSLPMTGLLQNMIEESDDECRRLPRNYRVDCVRQGYAALARTLPRRGEYAEVRAVLNDVSRDLGRITRQNRDSSQPKVRARRIDGRRSPAFAATGSEANAKAAAVISSASDLLLRSVPRSDLRYAHYVRIVSALDETAVLLRS